MFMRIRDFSAWLRHSAVIGPGCYLAGAVLMGAIAWWATIEAMSGILRVADLVQTRTATQPVAAVVAGAVAVREAAERSRQSAGTEPEASRAAGPVQAARTLSNPAEDPMFMYVDGSDGDTYRTVCVRLCDGYFWPVSFATNRSNLVNDRETCERSCGTPVRLYVHRVPGGSEDELQDLAGQPYTRLKTAFRFRTTYDAACRCTAQPWEQEAKDRHRLYALENEVRKGDRAAVAALTALKGKVEADRRQEQALKKAANAQLVAAGVISAASATAAGPPPSGRAGRTIYSSFGPAFSPGLPRHSARFESEQRAMRLGGPEFGGRGQGGGYGPLGGGTVYAPSHGNGRGGGGSGGGYSGGGGGSGSWRARAFGFSN